MDLRSWFCRIGSSFRSPSSGRRTRRKQAFRLSAPIALIDMLEARLLLTSDFGDAPDTTSGIGVNNYQTLAANGGPSHVIDSTLTTLYLGAGVDSESGLFQSANAGLDDQVAVGGRDDEDGVLSPLDLNGTSGAAPTVTVLATNTTGRVATLSGWIDFNRDGVFDNATERAQITVPNASSKGHFTLAFPAIPTGSGGTTYARFRLSTDVAAANATGAATDGEVEDYKFVIQNQPKFPAEFVGPVRIAEGLNGGPDVDYTDYFGYSSTSIGDLNRDGITDLVIGAPFDSTGGESRGAIYVMFLNSDGSAKLTVKIASGLNGGPTLANTDYFGVSLTSLGDLDGDGIVDLAVGASGDDTGGSGRGAVYILRLNADGTARSTTKIASALNGGPIIGTGDAFGVVASLGDLDGDGVTDIAVGAASADAGGTDRGIVHILRLKTDGTVKNFTTIANPGNGTLPATDKDNFGQAITTLGDLDGDGVVEIAVTASIHDVNGDRAGAIHVLRLNADGTVKGKSRIASTVSGAPTVSPFGRFSGMTAIGDVNGDGINDLAISVSEQQSATIELPDTVYILHLNSDGTIKRTNRVGDQIEGQSFLPGSSLLASSMTFLGDSNGDGRSELVIGMPYFRGSDGTRPSVFVLPLLDAQSPSTPVTPTITGPGATTPKLRPAFTWAAVAGASEYEISVNRDRLNTAVLDRIVVTGTSYTPTIDLGLGKFNVGVRAKNVTGTSAWSLRFDFSVVSAVELIPAPDGLIRRPTLAWKEMPGASKYEIFVSDIRTPNAAVIRTMVSGALTTFVPSVDLAHGTYRLSVRASEVDGTVGQWSLPDEFTIGSSTTVALVADQVSRRPKLEWNVIPGAASYDIWITDTRNSAKPPVRTTTTSAFFVLDRDLPTGSYRAWVRGIAGDSSFGQWSTAREFQTGSSTSFLAMSSPLPPGSSTTLRWTPIAGAVRYQVWVDDPAPGISPAESAIRTVEGNLTSLVVPVTPGTFRAWVRGVAQDGSVGTWSATLEFLSRGAAFSGTITVVNGPGPDRPTINWQTQPGVTSYEIRIDAMRSDATGDLVVNNLTATSFTPATALPFGNYQIQVRGVYANGTEGHWSSPVVKSSQPVPQTIPVPPAFLQTPTLRWNAVTNAQSYEVTLWNRDTSQSVFERRAASSASLTTEPLPDGNYRWWVVAIGPGGLRSTWSAANDFQIGGATTLSVQQVANGVTLSWTAVADADHYDLWINDSLGATVLREQNLHGIQLSSATQFTVGLYRAWIRAVSATGKPGAWSQMLVFSTV